MALAIPELGGDPAVVVVETDTVFKFDTVNHIGQMLETA